MKEKNLNNINVYNQKMIIGNREVDSVNGEFISVTNPADGSVVGTVPNGCSTDVKKAVESSDSAFYVWKKVDSKDRAKRMINAATMVSEKKQEIAKMLTIEQGKPLSESLGEVSQVIEILNYYAEEAKRIGGYVIPYKARHMCSMAVKEPIGVTAIIGPWNYPLALLALKIGPALACGCTAVVKPSSLTPLAAVEMIKSILHGGDFPPGTLNVITGYGSEIGVELCKNPTIRKISFTGSTDVGKSLMREAADGLKTLSLELGGNSPLIVWADADLETAVKDAVKRSYRNMGQICNSVNRIYVHKDIYEEFIHMFIEKTRCLKIGNGLDGGIDLGPMASRKAVERVKRHIEDALKKGAEIRYGGKKPDGKVFEKGYFFEPTVLTDVNHNMLVMTEETFGPVAPIMSVSNVDEAIKLANDSRYGLVSYAYTKNIDLVYKFVAELEAGTVVINHVSATNLDAPYGGIKESGFGRECGPYALEEYLYTKHISLNCRRLEK